jgi:hypothetical protein
VLNGIGGRTIAEAKERLTHEEYVSWCAYVMKRGPLNLGLRLEMGFAMLAHVTNGSMGGKSKLEDFLPNREEPEQEKTASLSEVFAMIKSRVKEVK